MQINEAYFEFRAVGFLDKKVEREGISKKDGKPYHMINYPLLLNGQTFEIGQRSLPDGMNIDNMIGKDVEVVGTIKYDSYNEITFSVLAVKPWVKK